MTYKRFEDMKAWKDARNLVKNVYTLVNTSSQLRRDYSLCDQLKRASYSIILNIAEGFERKSKKEFANFLNIAKGSAGEVRTILYLIKDNYTVDEVQVDALHTESVALSAQLYNFRKFLNQ